MTTFEKGICRCLYTDW